MNERNERTSWDHYFMQIASQCASRATCDRKSVGAVIVRDHAIIATGYNGSVSGAPHCDDVGHLMVNNHCVRTVHAEANAIYQAARYGARTDGCVLYTTASPCFDCFKSIVSVGIKRIVYGEFYRDERSFEVAKQLGIELVHTPLEWTVTYESRRTKPLAEVRASDVPRGMSADDVATDSE